MKKLAAYLRSILLTITIIAGLVICVVHAKIEIIATTKSLPVLISLVLVHYTLLLLLSR